MYAGRDEHNGGYKNFGHPRYVQAYGHDEVVPVTLTETADGPYYGWLRADGDEPCMIQQREKLFDMQFPYGVDAEVKAGKGRVVRLAVAEQRDAHGS